MKKNLLILFSLSISLICAVDIIAQADGTTDPLVARPVIANKIQDFALQNKLENEPAPNFSLRDLEGNEVSLADFKGKVVVLDFWATWCAPCIKSFPAMQMAVDKYKEDPNVRFLFINTWEQKPNPQQSVQQLIEKRGYNFQVLMDVKDPTSKKNPVVESYGVSGIPAKFIIDGKGNIRFKVKGFTGDNEAQVEELTQMIESAKKI